MIIQQTLTSAAQIPTEKQAAGNVSQRTQEQYSSKSSVTVYFITTQREVKVLESEKRGIFSPGTFGTFRR